MHTILRLIPIKKNCLMVYFRFLYSTLVVYCAQFNMLLTRFELRYIYSSCIEQKYENEYYNLMVKHKFY